MRLRKSQKEAVLKWIVEGLQSDEINDRAATFAPPFRVSRQQVDYYRKTRAVEIASLIAAGEQEALSEGLALVAERVKKLKQLGAIIETDIFGGFLWLDDVKGVGSGTAAQVVDFEKFNAAEVKAYLEVLDAIAKEMGQRTQTIKQEHSGKIGIEDDRLDDAIKQELERLAAKSQKATSGAP